MFASIYFIAALIASPCSREVNQAGINIQEGRPESALGILEAAAQRCPASAEILDLLGIANDLLGRATEAQQAFRRAIAVDPRAARPRTNLAVSLLRTGKEAEAVQELQEALHRNPSDYMANANLGAYFTRQQDWARALRLFEVIGAERSPALRQDPQFALSLFECLLATKQHKRALSLLPVAGENPPSALRFTLGVKLAEYGLYREAIGQLQAIPESEADAATMFNLGLAHSRLRHYDSARKYYFAAIDRNSGHSEAYFRVGIDFAETGDGAKAIPWMLRARRMEPKRTDIVYALGEELIASRYFQSASTILSAAVEANPRDAHLRVGLGDCAFEKQQFSEAASHYRAALQLDPKLSAGMIGLARTLAAEQKLTEARQLLSEVLSREPDHAAANAQMGRINLDAGDCPSALSYLRRAWAADSGKASVALDLARCYRRVGQPDNALEILLNIRERAASEAGFHQELARVYTDLKRLQEAQRELAEVRRIEQAKHEGITFVPPALYIH